LFVLIFQRRPFKKGNLRAKDRIRKAELEWIEVEDFRENHHNKIRRILLDLKAKDSEGKNTVDVSPTTVADVRTELLQKGEERKAARSGAWDDVKIAIETQKHTQERALGLLERMEVVWFSHLFLISRSRRSRTHNQNNRRYF